MAGHSGHAIAVTGLGVVTPAGCSLDEFWAALVAGRSVARNVQHVDVSESPIRFGCECDFDPKPTLSEKDVRRSDRNTQLAIVAAEDALRDAGSPSVDADRVATVVGTGFGGLETADSGARAFLGVEPGSAKGRMNPLFVPMAMPNAGSALIAMRRDFRGPCLTISTACAAGANAVGEGMRLLREGSADAVIAVGAEAPLTPWVMAAFAAAHALSERSDDPTAASRPFDQARDGFVIAEGAAALVLERRSDAQARGARVRAELLGYARNTDAFHLVAPPPDGRGARDCIRLALTDAGLTAADVAHVNAHGTSTVHNDVAEAAAIRAVFGNDGPPVTSVKGVLGHSIGAAGAVEAVASVLTLEHGTIPPTANYETPDPAIDLDVVAEPRALGEGVVVSNSFAFGGHNAVLVLGRT
ncbi:MAG: beta-ketoacyl-[acyl-carrier-protein] synthase family protein [Acidimicrobiia bacterium]